MRMILAVSTILVIVGALALVPGPARAAPATYDITMKITASTVMTGEKIKVVATGTMTFDPDTGAVTFDVMESDATDWHITGTGLLGMGDKVSVGQTTFDASALAGGDPFFTGTAFFFGKFKKAGAQFGGSVYAVADSFGDAPEGYTFNTGKVKAVRR